MAERRNWGKPRREENNKMRDSVNNRKRQSHSRSGKSGVANNREDNAGTKKTAYKNPANSNANKSQVSRRKYDVTGGEKQIKTGSKGKNVQGKPRQAHSSQYKPNLNSKCPISHLCGGCQYVDMPYEQQLAEKQKYIDDLLSGFGPVDKIIGMENPYHYRNKVTAAFRRMKSGEIISGVYEEGTHNILPVENCYVEDDKAAAIIRTFAGLIKSFKLQIYNEDTGTGLIRHLQIRVGRKTGQIMVIIVTASPVFPSKKNLAKALVTAHPEITTIVQNINMKDTSMVIGDRNQVVYGKGYIEDILCGKRFRISPGSFYQVNPEQTEVLYGKAIKYADLKKKETVIDAYCGIGTIGIAASDRAKKVIGVELNEAAVHDARVNVRMNKIQNVDIYSNDAGRFMVDVAEEGDSIDVVFMDPPRSGSTEEFMSSVITLGPKRVVYISCGPESLARDLKYMTKNGYQVIKVTPVDMFPLTRGVETVVLLTRAGAVHRG